MKWHGVLYSIPFDTELETKNRYRLQISYTNDKFETVDLSDDDTTIVEMINNGEDLIAKYGDIVSIYANLSEYKNYYESIKSLFDSQKEPFKGTPFVVLLKAMVYQIRDRGSIWKELKENRCDTSVNIRYNKKYNRLEYSFFDIQNLIHFDNIEMQRRGIELKRCKNCGKYFVPETRSDEIYCNNIFKGNRTCRQIGYENKVNGNEVLREYRKIYKTQNARKQRNKDNIQGLEQRFSDWSAYAKEQLVKCQNGEITLAEMRANISPTDWMKGGE